MRNTAKSKWRSFARETKGNVAILFGLAIIPIVLAVGVAVDYGSALSVRGRMSAAADAAALAIGSWTDLNDAQLKVKAQQFFDANYPPSSLGTAGKLNVAFVGDEIHVSVSGSVPTTFMKLANVDSVDVGASTVVSKEKRNIELVLILDTTGSMGHGGKMEAMQKAAKKMVRTLFAGKSKSDTLKIGVVPFSGAVNIGSDKLNSGWLDKGTYPHMSSISKEDFDYDNGEDALEFFEELEDERSSWDWAGCVRERGAPYELTDDAPTTGDRDSLFTVYLAPDEPDDDHDDGDRYYNDYIQDDDCGTSKKSKRTPKRCQEYTGKYNNPDRDHDNNGDGPNYNCPPTAVTPLINKRGTVIKAINNLDPEGNTVIPAGLLWGWRVLSPGEPFTEGTAYDDEEWIKAVVLLTDGENSISGGRNGHNQSVYNAFGYAAEGHLGDTDGDDAEEELNAKTAQVCNSIKAQGIQVYTIGFQVYDDTTQSLLKNCATQPDMYYNSPSNSQLAQIFQDIAQGLGDLRIAQ